MQAILMSVIRHKKLDIATEFETADLFFPCFINVYLCVNVILQG